MRSRRAALFRTARSSEFRETNRGNFFSFHPQQLPQPRAMANSLQSDDSLDEKNVDLVESTPTSATPIKVVWYRSTWWSAIALGLCNFAAPGIWGAMNSLGAGGLATPFVVNGAFLRRSQTSH